MSKVWLITGSSKGLGLAITRAALEKGDKVVATAQQVDQLTELATQLGNQVAVETLDVRDCAAAEKAIASAVERFGRIDVLVNNAGYGTIGSLEDTSIDDFRSQIETNLMGTVYTSRAAIPFMRKQGGGHIIQFSSVGGRIGALGRTAYSAAKWGVEGFSEALAKEVGPLGIKVTIIEPGGFRTDFAASSTAVAAVRAEYQPTIGAAARFQAEYHGKQPGDPARAAKVLIELSEMAHPPLRLTLGSDALKAVSESDQERLAAIETWRELSISTDYPSE
ncbi:NAD(P)-dependent dehydrogenase (short-subunit alcohol dehydrogenase family) [Granulicella aggregans]|uniref:NAD(P)-dependent dehydrogenase (Short-subunit alcohol dehydrogenase family) n=1 Tax=Granulicella aggregans TaxID=474949 RepID=A0A7W7ZK93_9BACT|nr:SDR family NAD(P)-dependent oxidoreductase [Granulicella aggregans]MBB5061124.1 NAD(P)-dependent dehydrogenase (short-subunit alcohol dehydrogenase family) [Granulicella aggregans]